MIISLEQSIFSVAEVDGFVEVCAAVTQGQLPGFLGVQLSTIDVTASELFLHLSISSTTRRIFLLTNSNGASLSLSLSLSLCLSAVSGSDYDGVTISLPFSASITRQCVNITISEDGTIEPTETFSVNLVNFSPLVALNVSTALVTIGDSDSECV